MSSQQAARRALAGRRCSFRAVLTAAIFLAGLGSSCSSGSGGTTADSHNAYVTLPQAEVVLQVHMNNSSGAISTGAQTVPRVNTSPTGLALSADNKFAYVANATENTVSVFRVNGDGTLTVSGNPVSTGTSPRTATVDASGKFLLVMNVPNVLSGSVSLYSIDAGSGALTEAPGSPFGVGPGPADLKMSGNFVYMANPNSGVVTAYLLDPVNKALAPIGTFTARPGASAIAIDPTGKFLYTANVSDNSVSAFAINSGTGALSLVVGSPYSVVNSPSGLAVDSTSKFLYVANFGSSNISGFTITDSSGVLTPITSNFPVGTGTSPLFLLFEPTGKYLYTGNQSGNNISGFSYDPGTGALTAISGSPFGIGSTPGAMQITH